MKYWLLILGLVSFNCFGQFAYVYQKYSPDKSHYIISKPYSSQEFDTLGNTTVYNSSGEMKWKVERYFAGESVFISNDGCILTFIVPFNKAFCWPIAVYKKGEFHKRYALTDLVDINKGYAKLNWTYDNFFKGGIKDTIYLHSQGLIEVNHYEPDTLENLMNKRKYFTSQEALYITTCEEKTIELNLANGLIVNRIDNSREWFTGTNIAPDSVITIKTDTKFKLEYGIPELTDGREFNTALADYLGFKNVPTNELGSVKIKRHVRVDISLLIDESGKAEILFVDEEDKELRDKISRYISDIQFTTKYNTLNIEKKHYFGIVHMDKRRK